MNANFPAGRGPAFLSALSLSLLLVSAVPGQAVEPDERVAFCTACHGEDGRPIEPDIPVLWGQEFYYLYVQLKDYKAGRRANEVMSDIAAELSKEEMQALAQFFSEKSWPMLGFRGEETDVASAESAASAGQCVQCHLGSYHGDSRVPRLAGQQVAYLERTMLEFKNRIRLNSPAKGSLFVSFDDADLIAMARYLADL